MPEATEYIVIEISSYENAEIAGYIKPEIKDRDYETELKGHFLMLGFPRPGLAELIMPGIFHKHFEVMADDCSVVLRRYSKKEIDDDPTRKKFVRGR